MARFISPVNSFKSGVLSKRLYSRTDISEYDSGLSLGKNAFIGKHGGAYKRSGLHNIFQLGSSQGKCQIESVTIKEIGTIFLVFTESAMRLYDEYGQPFSEFTNMTGDIGGYKYAVFDGVIIIVNENSKQEPTYVKVLLDSENQPYVKFIEKFTDFAQETNYPHTSPNRFDNRKVILETDLALTNRRLQSVGGWDLTEEFNVGDWVSIEGLSYVNGSARSCKNIYIIVGFNSSTEARILGQFYSPSSPYDIMFDQTIYNDGEGNGVFAQTNTTSREFSKWTRSYWSHARGWPSVVAIDEGRCIFGGAPEKPATINGSRINSYTDFFDLHFPESKAFFLLDHTDGQPTVDSLDYFWPNQVLRETILSADPYNFTIATKRESKITFMEASVNFVVGTGRQEFIITGNGATVSQKNISIRPHTSHGSSGQSIVYDNTVLFSSRSRQALHMFKYSEDNGSFVAKEVSILNPDLFETDKIKSMDWHEELGICMIVTDNGKFVTLTLNNETETTGFTTHEIDGTVIDSTYAIDPLGDYIALAVLRNGTIHIDRIPRLLFLERLSTDLSINYRTDANYLDEVRIFNKNVLSQSDAISPIRVVYEYTSGDYIPFNISKVMVPEATWGVDKIKFINDGSDPLLNWTYSDDGGATFDPVPYNTDFYIVPIDNGVDTGIRLATTPVKALANDTVRLARAASSSPIINGLLHYELTRENLAIPLDGYREGDVLQVYSEESVFSLDDVVVSETTLTATDISNGYLALPLLVGGYACIFVGKKYEFHIATMPIEAGQQWGSAMMGMKRIDTAMVRLYKTKSYKISTDGYNSEDRVFDDYESKRDDVKIQGSPERDHIVHIQNDKPEAIYVASVAFRGVSNDG